MQQGRLQQNQTNKHINIKKELNKLQLQVKLSEINSTWYQKTQRKMVPTRQNDGGKLLKDKQYASKDDKDQQQHYQIRIEQYEQKIQFYQHQIQKQQLLISKFRQHHKQSLQQNLSLHFRREKSMRQLSIRRSGMINNLRREIRLFISMSEDNIQGVFCCLQQQTERQLNLVVEELKRSKRQWKQQLRRILLKYDGGVSRDKQQKQLNTSNSKLSLKQLQQQLNNFSQLKQQQQSILNGKLINILTDYQTKRYQRQQKYKQSYQSIFKQIRQLQQSINQMVLDQQLQEQQNRQRILLLFEECSQNNNKNNKNNNQKNNNNIKSNKQKYAVVNYRHVIDIKQ